MRNLNPYLNFGGRTREALAFYQEALGGEIGMMQTHKEANPETPAEHADLVMHAEFKAEGVFLMASDGRPGLPVNSGDSVSLSLNFSDVDEQAKVFDALARDGQVTMPLTDAFWGARFGQLTDKFGIHWMFNCQKK